MKRITAVLLAITILFSLGAVASCSCRSTAKLGDNSRWKEVLEDTTVWLTDKYTQGNRSIVEKNLEYLIIPSDDGEIYFMRYKLSNISARDLLVFKDGNIEVIDPDTYDSVRQYNGHFPIDVTSVSDSELLSFKNCVSGKGSAVSKSK